MALQTLRTDTMPASLASAFATEIHLPRFKEELALWHFAVSSSDRGQWAEIQRFIPHASYELFGYDFLQRAQHALRAAAQPFDDLPALVKRLDMRRGGDFSTNNERPSLMISCDLPLGLEQFGYDKLRKGYRALVRCGTTIRKPSGALSLVGGISQKYPLEGLNTIGREPGFCLLEAFHPSKALEDEVKAVLLYANTSVATLACKARLYPWTITPRDSLLPAWHLKLEKTFGVKARSVLRDVKRLLPRSVTSIAVARLEDAVDLTDSRPFYSLVATGSVVELLLRIRLKRLGKSRIAKKGGDASGNLGGLRLPKPFNARRLSAP